MKVFNVAETDGCSQSLFSCRQWGQQLSQEAREKFGFLKSICEDNEFSHEDGEGEFFGFTRDQEAVIERCKDESSFGVSPGLACPGKVDGLKVEFCGVEKNRAKMKKSRFGSRRR